MRSYTAIPAKAGAQRAKLESLDNMANVIILGSQWGDEGKGKIVDLFSEQFDIVARYQGGHNAGHTVYIGEKKYVLKLIPSGILRPGKQAVIGNGMVIDPGALLAEIETLESAGVPVGGSLFISNRAHVLFPAHRLMEKMSEARPGRISIGTTSRCIGWSTRRASARRFIRVAYFLHRALFRGHYYLLMDEKVTIAKAWASKVGSGEDPRRIRGVRRACAADGVRHVAAAPRGDPGRQAHPLRRRAGHDARHRPWDLSVRDVVERQRGRGLHRDGRAADPHRRGSSVSRRRTSRASAAGRSLTEALDGRATASASAARNSAPSPDVHGAAAGSTCRSCATRPRSTASTASW